MAPQIQPCRMYYCLILLFVITLAGCATNPGKGTESDPSYEGLYGGSVETKRSHEAARSPETAEEAIALGDESAQKGEYDAAVFQYIKAMEINGGDATTLNKIGDIQVILGKYRLATQAYQKSIDLEAENKHALEGLGLMQLRKREYENSKQNLSHALQLDQLLWRAYNGLGTIADLEGEYAIAQDHYRRALQINPNSEHVLNNFGYSLYLSGEQDAALKQFRKAINIKPDYDRAWYNTGLVYVRQGKYDDAVGAFSNVMKRAQAYNDIGYISMIDANYEEAETFFRKAIKTSAAYYEKAHVNLEKLGRLQAKEAAVLAESPRDHAWNRKQEERSAGHVIDDISISNTYMTSAHAHSEKPSVVASEISGYASASASGTAEPVDLKNTTADTSTNSPAAPRKSGSTIPQSGPSELRDVSLDPGEAITEKPAASSSVESAKRSREYDVYREALLAINEQGYEDAAELFSQFLKDYPDSPYADSASYWLGVAYYLDDDYDQAMDIFNDLINNYPDSSMMPNTRLKVGYLHYQNGDWNEARQELNRVVKEYPYSEAAQMASYRLQRMKYEGH